VKIGVDGAKAALELTSVLKGKDLDKVQRLEDDGAQLIQELYRRTGEVVTGLAHDSNNPDEILTAGPLGGLTVGALAGKMGRAIGRIEHTRSAAAAYRTAHA
jgi:hypothetical protein